MNGTVINNLSFADDFAILAESKGNLKTMVFRGVQNQFQTRP